MKVKKQVNLNEFITANGYTRKEWDETVEILCKYGVAKGAYPDYNLLQLVISWLCNYESVWRIDEVQNEKS